MRNKVLLGAASLTIAALLATSCSSDSTTATNAGGGAQGSVLPSDPPGIAKAKTLVADYMSWNPKTVAETVPGPLSKAPPTGKRIAYMQCAVAVCKTTGDQIAEGAKNLGWTIDRVDTGATADSIQSAYNSVIANPPDAVFAAGIDATQVETQLLELKAKGIPYFPGAVADDPGVNNNAVIRPKSTSGKHGELNAAWVVADTGGKAKVAYFDLPTFAVLKTKMSEYNRTMQELCPDCKTDVVNVAIADIGKSLPGAVVSYLQAHPDVNYIVFGTASMTAGVGQALRDAGLGDKVKAVSSGGTSALFEEIKSGDSVFVADVPSNDGFYAWSFLDRAGRHFVGDPTTGEGFHELDGKSTPFMFATAETIKDPKAIFSGPDGYQDQFLKLWQVKK